MRLKIKPVQPSPSPEVQNQENHHVAADQEVLKTEAVEDEGQGCGWLIPEGNNPMISNSENNKNDPPELSPTTPSVPQYLVAILNLSASICSYDCWFTLIGGRSGSFFQGKRKRKPKELIDEISPITIKRKKKQPSVFKSEQVRCPLVYLF